MLSAAPAPYPTSREFPRKWVKSELGREALPLAAHRGLLNEANWLLHTHLGTSRTPAIPGPSNLDSHCTYLRRLADPIVRPDQSVALQDPGPLGSAGVGARIAPQVGNFVMERRPPPRATPRSCAGLPVDIWRSGGGIRHLSRRGPDATTSGAPSDKVCFPPIKLQNKLDLSKISIIQIKKHVFWIVARALSSSANISVRLLIPT